MPLRFGLELVPSTPISELVDLATVAEQLGLDTVWITDHYNNRNVYVTLSSIALRTNRVLLGPGVTNPYVVNPAWTASAIASLDEISGGRALLGIGAGDKATLEKLSIEWRTPLKAIEESVTVIRKLLRGEIVDFNGEFIKVKGAKLNYKPLHEIPIYIGAQAPRMLKLAASIGDGVLINASNPKDYEQAIEIIKEAAGDRFSKLDVVAYTCFSIDKDRNEARKAALPIVAFIVAGAPRNALERHGISLEKAQAIASAINRGDFKTAFSNVTEEMLQAFSIYGTPNECADSLNKLIKLGVTQIVFGSPIGKKRKEALKTIAEEVIPLFK